jgi:hypothetical protein
LYALKWYKGSHGKHLGHHSIISPSLCKIAQQQFNENSGYFRILSIHTERSATRPDIPLVYHHYSSCKLYIF